MSQKLRNKIKSRERRQKAAREREAKQIAEREQKADDVPENQSAPVETDEPTEEEHGFAKAVAALDETFEYSRRMIGLMEKSIEIAERIDARLATIEEQYKKAKEAYDIACSPKTMRQVVDAANAERKLDEDAQAKGPGK